MTDPSVFPTQEQFAKDTVASALRALTLTNNPCFDQILWDPQRHVLSLRLWREQYVNLWLNDDGEHLSERNGGPAADSEVLWEIGGRR